MWWLQWRIAFVGLHWNFLVWYGLPIYWILGSLSVQSSYKMVYGDFFVKIIKKETSITCCVYSIMYSQNSLFILFNKTKYKSKSISLSPAMVGTEAKAWIEIDYALRIHHGQDACVECHRLLIYIWILRHLENVLL